MDAWAHAAVQRKRSPHIAGGWGNHAGDEIHVAATVPLLASITDSTRPEGSTSPQLSNSPAPPQSSHLFNSIKEQYR
jgi:hypothetical protein